MQEQSLVITSKTEMSHDTKKLNCAAIYWRTIYLSNRFIIPVATHNDKFSYYYFHLILINW